MSGLLFKFLKNVLRLNVNESRVSFREGEEGYYWAVQAGLLTLLTFAWHRISPLAAFTSSAHFLYNQQWKVVIANLQILHCQL